MIRENLFMYNLTIVNSLTLKGLMDLYNLYMYG